MNTNEKLSEETQDNLAKALLWLADRSSFKDEITEYSKI
jgi:hypothetical protein